MNQIDPETYALTVRCPMDDASRVRALARARGFTTSALVAQLIHEAVIGISPRPEDAVWADLRRKSNLRRRQLQDERTQRGDYRKPGWENILPHSQNIANENEKFTASNKEIRHERRNTST